MKPLVERIQAKVVVQLDGCHVFTGGLISTGYGSLSVGRRGGHLEVVTRAENTRREMAAQTLATHCNQGHEFTTDNTLIRPGKGRDCRQCMRTRAARHKQRKSA